MPWNSTYPLGSVSVKANRTIGQQNTTYTEVTMGNSIVGTNTPTTRDHFWNVGSNEDGRHRFVQSPAFTVGAAAADPVVGTGMDAVIYAKTVLGRVEWFHRNAQGIYQFIPSFLSGTHVITGSYTNMVAVPNDVYGEIFLIRVDTGATSGQAGYFKSTNNVCQAWAYGQGLQGDSSAKFPVKFGNGSNASGLNIRVRAEEASAGDTWIYRVIYRAIN